MERKTGKKHVVIRASNGEVAVISQEYLDEVRRTYK